MMKHLSGTDKRFILALVFLAGMIFWGVVTAHNPKYSSTASWITFLSVFIFLSVLIMWPFVVLANRNARREMIKRASTLTPEQRLARTNRDKNFVRAALVIIVLWIVISVAAGH